MIRLWKLSIEESEFLTVININFPPEYLKWQQQQQKKNLYIHDINSQYLSYSASNSVWKKGSNVCIMSD
jgi:hypothetical protein